MIPQSAGISGCQSCDLGPAECDSGERMPLTWVIVCSVFCPPGAAWESEYLWRNEILFLLVSFGCILERLMLAWRHTRQQQRIVLPLCSTSLVEKGSAASGSLNIFLDWLIVGVCWAAQWMSVCFQWAELSVIWMQMTRGENCRFSFHIFWSCNLKSLNINIVTRKKKQKVLFSLMSLCGVWM